MIQMVSMGSLNAFWLKSGQKRQNSRSQWVNDQKPISAIICQLSWSQSSYTFFLQLSLGTLHQADQTITPGQYHSWAQESDHEQIANINDEVNYGRYVLTVQS